MPGDISITPTRPFDSLVLFLCGIVMLCSVCTYGICSREISRVEAIQAIPERLASLSMV